MEKLGLGSLQLPSWDFLPKEWPQWKDINLNVDLKGACTNVQNYVEDLPSSVKTGCLIFTVVVGTTTVVYVVYPAGFLKLHRRLSRRRCGLKMKKIRGDDGSVTSYAERGNPNSSLVTMLMVHGLGGTVDNWLPVVKLLPKDQHVIAIELPGHGDSTYKTDDDLSMSGMAKRVQQFIDDDTSGLRHRRIHMIGAAMGGTVCATFASKWTSYISILSLVCPAMRSPQDSDMVATMRSGGANPILANNVKEMRTALEYLVTEPPRLSCAVLRGVMQIRRPYLPTLRKISEKLQADVWAGEEDIYVSRNANKITVPTQVIWGEMDRIIHVSGMDLLEKELPMLKSKHILPKIGHSIFMQAPQTLTTLLSTFHQNFTQN